MTKSRDHDITMVKLYNPVLENFLLKDRSGWVATTYFSPKLFFTVKAIYSGAQIRDHLYNSILFGQQNDY